MRQHVARVPLPGIHTCVRDVADFNEHLISKQAMFLHTAFLTCFVVMLTNIVFACDCITVISTYNVAEQQSATASIAASCC